MTRVEHELFLRTFLPVPPPTRVATELASLLHDEYFKRGEVLYQAGEPAEQLFFVVNGSVELRAEGLPPWKLAAPAMVGILDAGQQRPYSRTAVAVQSAHALVLDFADYYEVLEENFEYAHRLLIGVAQGLDGLAESLGPDRVFAERGSAKPEPVPRRELDVVERLSVLRQCPFLQGAPVQALYRLAQNAEVRNWQAGTRIVEAGDPAPDLSFIADGVLRLSRKQPDVLGWQGPLELVAGGAGLGYDTSRYTIEADEEARTMVLSKDAFLDVAEDHNDLVRAAFGWLAREQQRVRLEISETERSSSPSASSVPSTLRTG